MSLKNRTSPISSSNFLFNYCIIAKNKTVALKILKTAKENNIGDFSIIPLEDVKRAIPKIKSSPKSNLLLGNATELINSDQNFKPIAKFLLGNLLIVSDIKLASSSELFFNWNIVDKNGTYLGRDLVLKNKEVLEHSHILGRKEKAK